MYVLTILHEMENTQLTMTLYQLCTVFHNINNAFHSPQKTLPHCDLLLIMLQETQFCKTETETASRACEEDTTGVSAG